MIAYDLQHVIHILDHSNHIKCYVVCFTHLEIQYKCYCLIRRYTTKQKVNRFTQVMKTVN